MDQWLFQKYWKEKKEKKTYILLSLHKKKEKNPKSNTNEKVEEIKGKVNNIKDILNNKLDYININIKHDINDKLDIIETLSDKVAEIKWIKLLKSGILPTTNHQERKKGYQSSMDQWLFQKFRKEKEEEEN